MNLPIRGMFVRAVSWLGDRFFPPPARVIFPAPAPLADRVVAAVGRALGALPKDITSGGRHRGTVRARHASALALRRLGLSFPEVARACGWTDHTSAMSAVARAEARMIEPAFALAVEAGLAVGMEPWT